VCPKGPYLSAPPSRKQARRCPKSSSFNASRRFTRRRYAGFLVRAGGHRMTSSCWFEYTGSRALTLGLGADVLCALSRIDASSRTPRLDPHHQSIPAPARPSDARNIPGSYFRSLCPVSVYRTFTNQRKILVVHVRDGSMTLFSPELSGWLGFTLSLCRSSGF
jgi:hypothetical protein